MAEELGISLSTSVRIRQEDKGNLPEPSGGGRPSKVSDRTKRLLARKFDSGAFTWIDEGQELVESIVGRHVHEDTVRSYLEEQGLKCYIKQKSPISPRTILKQDMHLLQDGWTRMWNGGGT